MQFKKKNKKGIVFWITGYPGVGKTSISDELFGKIKKKFGPTLKVSGDDLRLIFDLKGYTKNKRKRIGLFYHQFCKKMSFKGINVLIDVVCLFDDIRKKNRLAFKKYIEIYVKSDIKKIINRKSKPFYRINKKNVWGKDIAAQLPEDPDIIIINNFSKSIKLLSNQIYKKILKLNKNK